MISKRYIYVIVTIVIVGIFVFIAFNLLSKGTLQVTASNETDVRIINNKDNSEILNKRGSFSTRLKPSSYTVSASTATSQFEKVLDIKASSKEEIKIPELKSEQSLILFNIEARGINKYKDTFQYVDNNSDYLMSLSEKSTQPSTINLNLGRIYFYNWADSNHGIFLGDRNGDTVLSSMTNGQYRQYDTGGRVVNAAAINNVGDIFVSSGKEILSYTNGGWKKVTETIIDSPTVSASDKILLISSVPPSSEESISNFKHKTILTNLENNTKFEKEYSAIEKSINPSSTKIAITTENEAFITDNKLNKKKNLPPDIKYLNWISENELSYVKGSELWIYDSLKNYSYLITNAPLNASITSTTSDAKNIYFSTSDDNQSAFYKVQKEGEVQIPSNVSNLIKILPLYEDNFKIELYNFGTTKIIIRVPESPDTNFTQKNRQEAHNVLKETGINTSNIPIEYQDYETD